MNNDASSPPSAPTRDPSPRPADADADADANAHADDAAGRGDASPERDDDEEEEEGEEEEELRPRSQSRSGRRRRRRRRRRGEKRRKNPGLVKKLAFVTHLLRTLDLVVFAELSSLYYMECSIFRFALRGLGQYMYLTPKDETFPFLMPATRVHVILIVVPNIICLLLHLFASLPQGAEFHRGYQHGGLVIDFVGQKPPTFRLYYLLADVAILALQCLMLTIHTDRENLRAALKTFKPFLPELVAEALPARTAEDLDAEERGVSRHAPDLMVHEEEEEEGIELQPLIEQDENAPRNTRGEEPSTTYLSDLMSSGNAVLGEYHVMNSITAAAMELERTAAHSIQALGYRATYVAMQAQRRNGR